MMACHILLQSVMYYKYSEIILVFIALHTYHCLVLVLTGAVIFAFKGMHVKKNMH